MENASLQQLIKKIDDFTGAYYRRLGWEGLILSVAVALSGLLVLAMIEFFAWSSSGVRGVLWWGYIISMLAVLTLKSIVPFLQSAGFVGRMSRRKAALLLSEKIPEIQDRLINVLDLQSENPAPLLLAALEQKSEPLVKFSFQHAIDSRLLKKFALFNASVALLWGLLWVSGSEILNSAIRVKNYQTVYEKPAPFHWIWENDTVQIKHNEAVELRFRTIGDVQPERGQAIINGQVLPLQRSGSVFVLEIPRLRNAMEFYVEASGVKSNKYKITPLYYPLVSGLEVSVIPPKYTGLEAFSSDNANITIPEGSRVEWFIQSLHADSLRLKFLDDLIVQRVKKGKSSVEKQILNSGSYSIELTNHEQNLYFDQSYFIQVQPDLLPKIDVDWLNEDVALRAFGSVRDDYGVRNIFLQVEENGNYRTVETRKANASTAGFRFDYALDELHPGKSYRFRIGATDNDGIRGGKTAYSSPYEIRIESIEEREERRKESISSSGSAIDEFQRQSEENRREAGKLMQQKKGGEQLQFKDEQQLRDLMLKDANQLEKAIEALEELQKNLENSGEEQDKENAERIEEQKDALQDLLDEIRQLLEENKPEELLQKAEEIQKKMQERSRELKVEQNQMEKMENLRNLLKSIDELRELTEELDQTDVNDKEKIEEIRDQLENWQEKAEKAMEKFPELEEKLKQEGLREEGDKAKDDLDKSKSSPKEGDAQDKKNSAKDRMEKMHKDMMDSFQQMQQKAAQENMEDLRQLLRNLILLSFSQEKQSDAAMSSAAEESLLRQIVLTQEKMDLASEHILDSLYALASRVPEIESKVRTEALRMVQRMDLAKQALRSDRLRNFGGDMKASMEHSNELALLLDQILQQMMMDMSGDMQGDQNCNKPGSGQPDISELLDEQKGLGEEAGQEEQGEQEGDQGGDGEEGKDGEDGDNDSAESFRRLQMMMRQEGIRKNLQKLLKQQGREGEGQDVLEMMEEQEKDIIMGKPFNELRERQKEIEVRMLELEKAERKQEQDDERRGETAKDKKMPKSSQEEYIRKKMEEVERLQRAPFRFTPYYEERRQRVLEEMSRE